MSVSDLMAGLMVVFLFVALAFIKGVGQEQRRLEQTICKDIRESLGDVQWKEQIEICDDGVVVKFKDPDALFNFGEAELRPKFRRILVDFFPRYLSAISQYRDEIAEVRIEGHTDDTGPPGSKLDKYFFNMGLSQDRTRAVLQFLFQTPAARTHEEWLIRHMTANGLSSSLPVYREDNGRLDKGKSRRVEFKIRLKTPKRLREIAEAISETGS